MIIGYRCNYCGEDFDYMSECEEHEPTCSCNPKFQGTAERLNREGMSNQEINELYDKEQVKLQRWIESSRALPEVVG